MGPAIEEPTVIAMQQFLFSTGPDKITPRALLIDTPNNPVEWLCDFNDEARRKWHEMKMQV